MTLHYEDAGLRLWHGMNMEILPTFADGTFDSIVTDPPYELGFMGKGWDSSGIAYDVDVWQECLRVLKPGGHLLAFGGSRTWHRMAVAIEDAGFEMRDSIAWLYGSGFPKSMDVSKAIDKAAGAEREVVGKRNRILNREPSDKWVKSNEESRIDRGESGLTAGSGVWSDVTCPATEEARQWEGWGTALKPAFEPIVVARKPFRGTVAANVLVYGTGALNIDATRIATDDKLGGGAESGAGLATKSDGWDRPWMKDADEVAAHAERVRANVAKAESLGRWPTNVVLDDSQADALDEQTGVLTSGKLAAHHARAPKDAGILGSHGAAEGERGYGDSGGASRFFPTFRYEAKAPTSERPNVEGTVHATVKPLALMRWLVRLVTRPGGRVLDLYAGSGTTGEAALLEGMECDLIEAEADHLPLILARIRKPLQPSMFGDWDGDAA
ncbi:DNA methyltransferase [Microbacterium sp. BR1]|uniref:DNA methyltransferase n=1 Tax=Microbacterium sp. BR1 TaxID=1070896 RepID=UPI000C2C719A|nr:DNA methyltransferase [Microbacterium sp. BR1]